MHANGNADWEGGAMLALKPITLTPSQRYPNKVPQLGSFPAGMNLVHICRTTGLVPSPLGSQGELPAGPQLDPVCILKTVGTGGLATESALHAASHTSTYRITLRLSTYGTARS